MTNKYHFKLAATPGYMHPKTDEWLLNHYKPKISYSSCSDPDCDCMVVVYVFKAEIDENYTKLISIIDNSHGHVRMYKAELIESKYINSLES